MKKILFWTLLPLLTACGLTQEVEIELPEYEPQIVVECYLQPGQPYLLTLIESTSYFDDVRVNYVRDAVVTITHDGRTDTLSPLEIAFDTPGVGQLIDTALLKALTPIFGESLYFYFSFQPVPASYLTDFDLEVRTPAGEVLRSRTQIMPPVEQLPLEWKFNDDSLSLVLTRFQDDPARVNYYRRLLQERERRIVDNPDGSQDTLWVSDTEQDFTVDDELLNGQMATFGTGFEYRLGDTVISTIYHITADYYRFVQTRDAAIQASFSPFGQPAVIYSNIEGGTGIFTGITSSTVSVVVGK
ncbi:MAG: hypothetical protein OHK0039_15340 [Bacteroidia bacterium]